MFSRLFFFLIFIKIVLKLTHFWIDSKDYEHKPEHYMKPRISWAYWQSDQAFNRNQIFAKTNFAQVDCDLMPNLIYWEETNINFGNNFAYDWIDEDLKNS